MPTLGSSNSEANKIYQKYGQMGYSYLIEEKTLWEKEKLLVMSNFFFSHNVFKSCLSLMRQNEYSRSKGLKSKFHQGFNIPSDYFHNAVYLIHGGRVEGRCTEGQIYRIK